MHVNVCACLQAYVVTELTAGGLKSRLKGLKT